MAILLKSTKELIFDTAIRIIADVGFEKADMRSIAFGANVKVASIYNHYACKQDIFNLILDYYLEHFYDNRRPDDEIRQFIHDSSSKRDIINALLFTFETEDTALYQRMILISKIIYMHLFQEPRAKEIFQTNMTKDSETLVQQMLDYAVKIKKLKPFDTKTYAVFFVSCRNIMAIKAFIDPNYAISQLEEEKLLNDLLIEMLP